MTAPTSSSTTTQTAQITTTASTSSAASGLNILGLHSTSVQAATIRLRVTSATEYPNHLFVIPTISCNPIAVPDGLGGQTTQTCQANQNSHLHSATVEMDVPVNQNPIPPGAREVQQSFVPLDPTTLPQPLPQGMISLEWTTDAIYDSPAPQCPVNQIMEGQNQIDEVCHAENAVHKHRRTRPLIIPRNQNPIRQHGLAFNQQICYVPLRVTAPSVSTQSPPSKAAKKERTAYLPLYWKYLPASEQKDYLNDTSECDEKGGTYKMIAQRHGITHKNVHSLIPLTQRRPRNRKEEHTHACDMQYFHPNFTLPPLQL